MSETRVWVLMGCTGEYSDRVDWYVRAYDNEAAAMADCTLLNAACEGLEKMDYDQREKAVEERLRPHDPEAAADYSGTWYSIVKLPLVTDAQIPRVLPPEDQEPE